MSDSNIDTLFPCTKCGICCQNLHLNVLYKDLDRGDGTCRFFNEGELLCSVYDDRPKICNIDVMYKNNFVTSYSKQEFYELNLKECNVLQKNLNNLLSEK